MNAAEKQLTVSNHIPGMSKLAFQNDASYVAFRGYFSRLIPSRTAKVSNDCQREGKNSYDSTIKVKDRCKVQS